MPIAQIRLTSHRSCCHALHWALVWLSLLVCATNSLFAQAGTRDTSFVTNDWSDFLGFGPIVLQSDGKVLVTTFHYYEESFIQRLNPDGTPDPGFNIGPRVRGKVACLVVQKDGRILVAGDFTGFSGPTNKYLVRLNPDGSLDDSFHFVLAPGEQQPITVLAIQSDGKILYGGPAVILDRLEVDGKRDTSFQRIPYPIFPEGGASPATHSTHSIKVLDNDEILIAPDLGFTKRHSNGAADKRFINPLYRGRFIVDCMASERNGRVLISGTFTNINNTPLHNLARFNPDWTLDTNFTSAITGRVFQVQVTPDNKILVAGAIAATNGLNQRGLIRLNPDGSIDGSFSPAGGILTAVRFAMQDDGKCVVFGDFTNFGGVSGAQLVRVLNDSPASPVILEQPTSQTRFVGDTVRLTVSPSCLTTPVYSWLHDGGSLPGFTNDILVISNCIASDAGAYSVIVSNSMGAVTSSVAMVMVQPVPPQAGWADPGFFPGSGPNSTVRAMAGAGNGTVLVAGSFTAVDGVSRNRIARLNPDGRLDLSFDPGIGATDDIHALAIQPDGKILAAGAFTNFNGVATGPIVRLHPDGTVDNSFSPPALRPSIVYALALAADGKVLLGGIFPWQDLWDRRVIRLNSTGSLDTAFICNINSQPYGTFGPVYKLTVLETGKILAAGALDIPLVRLLTNGTVDTSFYTPTNLTKTIYALALGAQSSIFTSGYAPSDNAFNPIHSVFKLNPDGRANTDFSSSVGLVGGLSAVEIDALSLDDCGRVLVGGSFPGVNGANKLCFARLDNTGASDFSFNSNPDVDGKVFCILPQPNGSIWVGGDFTQVGGAYRPRVARLLGDPPNPPTLSKTIQSHNIVAGTPVALDPGASYCSENSFQWFQNGVSVLGATNSNLTLPSPRTTDSGDFYVVVGNQHGMVTSSVATLTVSRESIAPGSPNIDFYPSLPRGAWKGLTMAMGSSNQVVVVLGNSNSTTNLIVKLNQDGSRDPAFNVSGLWPPIYTVAVETSGAVWAGGYLTGFGSTYISTLARLLPDGSIDRSVPTLSGLAEAIAIQPDGKILVGGSFTSPPSGLLRLLPSGARDTNFLVTAAPEVTSLALQKDGKIIVAGSFTNVGNLKRRGVARLNSDGTPDASFQMPLGTNAFTIDAIALGKNEQLFVSGYFSASNETRRSQLILLRRDGSIDPTFDAAPGSYEKRSLAVAPDGKLIVAGGLTTFRGVFAAWLARLNTDGSLDSTFNMGTGPDGDVLKVAVHPDGRIYAAGAFTQFNGLPRPGFAVINGVPNIWNISHAQVGLDFYIPVFSGWNAVIEAKEDLNSNEWLRSSVHPVGPKVTILAPRPQQIYRLRYE